MKYHKNKFTNALKVVHETKEIDSVSGRTNDYATGGQVK